VLLLATGVSMSAPHTTPGTILGQCTFTLLSLTMLGLASHGVGVHAVQERAIDIALGAGIAVGTVLVVAPRGLHRRLRTSIAELLVTAGQAIGDAPAQAVRGQNSGSLGILARSQFLRCVDIVDVMNGSAEVQHDHLVDWLDAARIAGQACVTSAMCATAACASTPAPADWAEVQARYRQQATALRSGNDLAGPAASAPLGPAEEPWTGAAAWLLHNADHLADLLESLRFEQAEHRRTPTRT
jgi:hypothetical protein